MDLKTPLSAAERGVFKSFIRFEAIPFIQINPEKAKTRFDDLGNRNVIMSGAKDLPYWKKQTCFCASGSLVSGNLADFEKLFWVSGSLQLVLG